jgi:hypothetical protein
MIIMDGMKRLLLLLGCSGALLCGADLTGVHTVYVMPMGHGLDQYLANRIASQGVFRVVTDPKLADALITDLIGEGFQTQLENISPTPNPPEPAAAPEPTPAEKTAKATVAVADDKSAKPAGTPTAAPAPAATPAPKPAQTPAETAPKSPAIEKAAKPAKKNVDAPGNVVSMFSDTENKVAPPISSFSRAKGTIFLVDAKSRQIVWSTFDPSKGSRNHDLDRTAADIVSRLKKDLKPKKQP